MHDHVFEVLGIGGREDSYSDLIVYAFINVPGFRSSFLGQLEHDDRGEWKARTRYPVAIKKPTGRTKDIAQKYDDGLVKNRDGFVALVRTAMKGTDIRVPTPLMKAIVTALSERDETADPCTDSKGNPEPDPKLRDTESVPLKESIYDFFDREVRPHVPDAWINEDKKCRDAKDGEIGVVGYEINFNRYFYQYEPPRPLEEIDADIKKLEAEIAAMLGEVTR